MSQDKIIVISTHLLEEVHALCNRAMIIAAGRLLVDDTPAGLIARSRYHEAVTLVVEQPERVASVLSELPEARKVELRERELTVFPAPGQRLFEVIADAVRANGWAVSELRLEAGRLDEVFRQVTREEVS
jgi:ABC-2 type transport system ATP-binding protein